MSDQGMQREVNQLDQQAQALARELERTLRVKHPRLAGFLDMTITPRRLWGGGYDVLGETYPDIVSANEAVKAAILHKLIEVDRMQA